MLSNLAGHLPLQDMIRQQIDSARTKLAAVEEREEKKENPFFKKKNEKKDEKKEDKEKKSSVIDSSDPYEVEKLASALDEIAEDLIKEADSIFNGGESHQGGEQLATQGVVPGKQSYTSNKAKHQIPTHTGLESKKENGPAATAIPDTQHKPPVPLHASYPKKGVLKTAEESEKAKKLLAYEEREHGKIPSVKEEKEEDKKGIKEKKSFASVSALQSALAKMAAGKEDKKVFPFAKKEKEEGKKEEEEKEKKSEALDFILGKVAEFRGGGETLDSKSGQGPKAPSQPGRQLIANNSAPAAATKREAKAPVKKSLSEVLTEPALTSSTDNIVQQNLRNASKGGVKIATVKQFIKKIAEGGCLCGNKGECDYCRMKQTIEKKRADRKVKQSMGAGPSISSSTGGAPTPMPGSLPA